jgi:hypothetical protein
MNRLIRHIAHFREFYVWGPLYFLTLTIIPCATFLLSGRWPLDDLGELSGINLAFFVPGGVLFFVVLADGHLYRSFKTYEEWKAASFLDRLNDDWKPITLYAITLAFAYLYLRH